ncbi:SCP2 sterol-binding domain-containing protein [Actinomadura rupiterrae]|uniref:SCP2 sterol-binding domain-containing protein n=1 Tax=Actinomadura rupiterrae TaxID=559627 RepID=UPI0020A4ED1C|nr:SCP2 sterol-binding domain-containing protein [Actinomadura rupiterrae]MCP2337567.1 hypothetical protein [Actinomadura rupiterrae]
MADLSALREIDDLPSLLDRLRGTDVAELLDEAEPADLARLAEHISTPADLAALVALADDQNEMVELFIDKADSGTLRRIAENISTPGELKELLALAGNDTTVKAFVAKAGPKAMLNQVFTLMPTRFVPEKIGDSGVVEWHITDGDDQHVYILHIADGTAVAGSGGAEKPRTTLTMAVPVLLQLCAGTVDGVSAFMNQKVKLSGDMLFGAKLAGAFDTSA